MGHPRAELDYVAGGRIVITRMSVSLIRNPRSTNFSTRRRPSFLDLVARIFGLFAVLSDNSKKVLAQTHRGASAVPGRN
jgi:hypothetical protein